MKDYFYKNIKYIFLIVLSFLLWFLSILCDKMSMKKIDILAIFCIKAIGILIVIAFVFVFNLRNVINKNNKDLIGIGFAIISAILTGISMIIFLKAIF
jgi:uncharacterized membrane protein